MTRRTALFCALALAGLAVFLIGLAWDAYIHAAGGMHDESLLTLDNPSHPVMGAGILGVLVGVTGTAYGLLESRSLGPLGYRLRREVVTGIVALALASAGVVVWSERISDAAHSDHEVAASREVPADGVASGEAASDGHDHGHDHGHGQATLVLDGEATPEQRAIADRFVERTVAGTVRFENLDVALQEGYEPVTPVQLTIVHYVNREYTEDGRILDPERPESLVYAHVGEERILLGAMFLMPMPGMPGPQFAGPLATWHTHSNLCYDAGWRVRALVGQDGSCPAGTANVQTREMLHVWTVDNPDGPYAHDMEPAFVDDLVAQRS